MLVIYGAPAVGKTTLVSYLRVHFNVGITELDEEIVKESNGVWPEDAHYRNRVIVPRILERIGQLDGGIFITSGLTTNFVLAVRRNHGKVALLYLSEEKLIERNNKRIAESGHDVIDQIKLNLADQQRLKKEVGFDYIIDASGTVEEIASEILSLKQ